jgi:hypothetical protein
MALILSLDYETSAPLDLTVVGAYRYAQSATIMCAGYAIYEENTFEPEMVKPWRAWKGEPMPDELVRALMTVTVKKCAWNAQFERLITKHCTEVYVNDDEWFCTAARARASAYPGKLDLCAKALAIPQKKDLAGGKLMKKLSTEGTGTEEEYERVLEYCLQDVVVEATIGMVVRDLTREEWQDYWVCERMNDRGIPIDAELARAAQKYAAVEAAEIAKELNAATGGEITSAKQFGRIKKWVGEKAPEIALQFTDEETGKFSLDKSARTAIFESDLQLSEEVREVLELIDDAGRASTAKYAAIENRTDTDGRLRGAYLFNGAGQTGRFSAMGFQPHNLVRDKLDNAGDVIEAVLDGASAGEVTKLSGQNMLTTLARMLRPTIVAENGNVLAWADYSAVEARALPWLSASPAAEPLLDIFRKNEDVYKHAAMGIYGVPFDKVDKAQRQIGKIACFGPDTQVLTHVGPKAIVEVTEDDLLWDGVEWVRHDGVIPKGSAETLNLLGVEVTPDHLINTQGTWLPAQQLASSESTLCRALATASENFPWWVLSASALAHANRTWRGFNAPAGLPLTSSTFQIYEKAHPPAVTSAPRRRRATGAKTIGRTPMSALMTRIAAGYSVVFQRAFRGVKTHAIRCLNITASAAFAYTPHGCLVAAPSWLTSSRLMGGTYRSWSLTASTLIAGMSRAIFGSFHVPRTFATSAKSASCSRASSNLRPVFDILNAGSRNRFTILTAEGPLIVHNCLALGYQGGKNAFRKMARAYGLKIGDDLADEIKVAWRLANPWAKTFWRDLEGAAVRAARNPGTIETAGRIKYLMHGDMLYALLPCGRLIAYPEVEVVEVDGKYGPQARVSSLKASMHPKKGETAWPRVTLYGGLLAENATQGFCASLLRAAARRLDEAGWPVVMHTHDEVLVEVGEDEIEEAKAALQEAMLTNPWPDLPLAADPEHGYSYDK